MVATYGFTEAKAAFLECVEGARSGQDVGYHLFPDIGFVEILREEYDYDPATMMQPVRYLVPCEDGEVGIITYSQLVGHGTVVWRYPTFDYGSLTNEPCPACGRTVPRILPPIFRKTSDMMKTFRGTQIDCNSVFAILSEDSDIEKWQVVFSGTLGGSDEAMEVIVAAQPDRNIEGIQQRIMRLFEERIEVKPTTIIFETREQLLERLGTATELKEDQIVDLRTSE